MLFIHGINSALTGFWVFYCGLRGPGSCLYITPLLQGEYKPTISNHWTFVQTFNQPFFLHENTIITYDCYFSFLFYRPHPFRRMGKVLFSQVCVCPHQVGIPHLHPMILPLVPCPFWVDPSDWSRVPSWGGGVPQSQVGAGVPSPRQWGHHSPRQRVPQARMGYSPLARAVEGVLVTLSGMFHNGSCCHSGGCLVNMIIFLHTQNNKVTLRGNGFQALE